MFRYPTGQWRLILALCLGCGHPAYRLDGQVTQGVPEVKLVDGRAASVVDSLHEAYTHSLAALQQAAKAALDSVQKDMASLEKPLSDARARQRDAGRSYKRAFSKMTRFRSFAGNAVFSDADSGVRTSRLLEEIARGSYQGRPFSLETRSEIRNYIRSRLAPLERRARAARDAVARLKRSQSGGAKARSTAEAEHNLSRVALRERVNREILKALQDRVLRRTAVDSTRRFVFQRLPQGQYHLYAPQSASQTWLLPVDLHAHTRQDLGEGNRRVLLIPQESS